VPIFKAKVAQLKVGWCPDGSVTAAPGRSSMTNIDRDFIARILRKNRLRIKGSYTDGRNDGEPSKIDAVGRGRVYNKVIADTEKMLIEESLRRSFGNQAIAAKILGINRNTMRAKVRKLNIDPKQFRI
jgi:hypothetical protein